MITVLEKEQLKLALINKVRERYGIFLISPDVAISDDNALEIIVKGSPFFTTVNINASNPVNSVIEQLFEGDFDVKATLIDLKIRSLNVVMKEEIELLKARLLVNHPGKYYALRIVSLGYEGSSWMTPEEAEFGYPEFGIQIKDTHRFCCEYKIDSDNPLRFFDRENIFMRLEHQISSSF